MKMRMSRIELLLARSLLMNMCTAGSGGITPGRSAGV